MKAIRYNEPRNFRYEDVATPKPGPDQVLIRVRACGLCGTDLHIHEGEFIVKFPVIPGHEFTGEVAELGANVTHLHLGDRVVVDNMIFCGHCFHCVRNRPLYCENLRALGVTEAGGFAEYVLADASLTFPTTLSWRQAVMVEPTACAVHGLDVLDPRPGGDVLLCGAGPTGLVMAQLLRHHGAARLVVAAPAGRKLELAAELAADEVVEIDRKDPMRHQARLRELAPHGFDCVIEATGVPALAQDIIRYVRRGGQVLIYGVYPESARVEWSPYQIFLQELTIKGSFSQARCFDRALRFIEQGRVAVDKIVSDELPLSEYGKALDGFRERRTVKTMLIPTA